MLSSCIRRYGDVELGLSTGAAIADMNPERALVSGRKAQSMTIRDYATAVRSRELKTDAYSFYGLKGTQLATDFSPLRVFFGSVLAAKHPELAKITEALPDLDDLVSNVSMRLAYGGWASGSSWHAHGPALAGVVAGRKSWFFRPTHSLPTWLEDTLRAKPMPSSHEWVKEAAAAGGVSWKSHVWHCSQSAGELMFVPETLRHAVYNEEETFGVTVQVDMQVNGGTPLHVTALHGLEEATKLLLENGADANAKASNGGTPLHHAAFHGHMGVALLLLEAGAKSDAKDMRGATPLQVTQDVGTRRLLTKQWLKHAPGPAAGQPAARRKPARKRRYKDEI